MLIGIIGAFVLWLMAMAFLPALFKGGDGASGVLTPAMISAGVLIIMPVVVAVIHLRRHDNGD